MRSLIRVRSYSATGVSETWGRLVPDHGGGRDVADGAAAGEGEPERGEDDGAGADQPEMGKQPAPRFLTLPARRPQLALDDPRHDPPPPTRPDARGIGAPAARAHYRKRH